MKKKVIVLSLGGSLIIPDEIDTKYLKKFKEVLLKNKTKYNFIIVCGGGQPARKYISALKTINANHKLQSFAGIAVTRMNARFMTYFFDKDPEEGVPHTIETLERYLKKKGLVFCGALEYQPKQTSDSTAADLAKHFNAPLINLTDVTGLYDKDPRRFKNAKLISKISWQDFLKKAQAIQFKPGQHFVLDQTAAEIIFKQRIPTYIIGKDLKQLDNLLANKKFRGTLIAGQ